MESTDNRRKRNNTQSLAVLFVLLVAFSGILYALVIKGDTLKPEIITLVGGFGGTVLAMVGMIVSFEFGSSKGSQIKDEMLGATPSTTTVITPTSSTTTTSTPAATSTVTATAGAVPSVSTAPAPSPVVAPTIKKEP